MAWNPQSDKIIIIKVGDETVTQLPATSTADEIKNKIIEIMKEKGINRADVYVNNKYTTPEEFSEAFSNALAEGGNVEIKIVKVEKAA